MVAGLITAALVFEELDATLEFFPAVDDGARVEADECLAEVRGNARAILMGMLLGMIMASNMRFVIPAGQDARRYFVLEVSTKRLQDSLYFGAIAKDLDETQLTSTNCTGKSATW